jgi:uncharacterized protein (DUF736 family)
VHSFAQSHHIMSQLAVYASEGFLAKVTNYVSVQLTDPFFAKDALRASNKSEGFTLSNGGHSLIGWYSNNTAGDEYIEFELNLPVDTETCYVLYLSAIKS